MSILRRRLAAQARGGAVPASEQLKPWLNAGSSEKSQVNSSNGAVHDRASPQTPPAGSGLPNNGELTTIPGGSLSGDHARRTRPTKLFRRLLTETRPYWLLIGLLLLLNLLTTPLALLAPLPLKIAVDSAIGSHPLPGFLAGIVPAAATGSAEAVLLLAIGLVVVIALLNLLQELVATLLSTYAGERVTLDFRARLFRHAQRLSLARHDRQGTSDAIYRIQWDATSVQYVAVFGLTPFISAVFMLVGVFYVTARIDWQLAAIALVISPVLFLLTRMYRRRLRTGWRDAKQLDSSAFQVVQEVLGALRVVKAFGQEDRERERFVRKYSEGMWKRIRLSVLQSAFALLTGLTTAAGTAAVLYIGVHHVQQGTLTLGSLILVMGYLAQLYQPLQALSNSLVTLQSQLASADRAFSFLDEEPDVPERPHAIPLERSKGHVEFREVSFAYDDGQPALTAVSFDVPPGARVGIAGRTGAGKTTLINLLTRMYDPTSGDIRLDGTDLRAYRLSSLRNQFAIVLQEPILFSTTIAENIAYARPDASGREIFVAADAANAHDFICELEDGYDTLVGERGMTLSGGERQRIALARAFLKDAPILILDEPTSSVDIKTEAVIIDAMQRLMAGRTAFMIAHRLGTLDLCDIRFDLEHGRLAEARAEQPTRVM